MEEENINKHLFQKYDLQTTPVHVSFAVLLYLHEDEKQETVHQNLWGGNIIFWDTDGMTILSVSSSNDSIV
jgi:hypothetical protein